MAKKYTEIWYTFSHRPPWLKSIVKSDMLFSHRPKICIYERAHETPKYGILISTLKVNIMLFRILCSIEFQGPCSKNLNLRRSENCIFGIYDQYIGFLSMPHSCITRQSENIKSKFFQLCNRKRRES